MRFWTNIKIRIIAIYVLLKVYIQFFNKSAILDPQREDGNGAKYDRMLRPLEKSFRQESAGKIKLTRADIIRYEFLSSLSVVDSEEIPDALEDTIQSLLLWSCSVRAREGQE